MNQDYPLIPDEAFLFFPSNEQIVQFKNGIEHRIIFDGDIQFSKQEQQKIKQFKEQISKKQKNTHLNIFTDNLLLRFLQATQFNYSNCIKALREFHNWKINELPTKLNSDMQKLLKQGILYMSGRDYCYRPILVVNVGKILELAPKEKIFLDTLGFFFQFIISNCLIEGQVQNWVSIIDLGNASVFSLGGPLVDTITFLSSNFRSRVHHSYLVNAPSSVKWVWGMVKSALNEDQLRKLSLSGKKQLNEQDFIEINQNQIEIKYGGLKTNINQFWPLTKCQGSIKTQKSNTIKLISKQQYNKKYVMKELEKRKINKKFISNQQINRNILNSVLQRELMADVNSVESENSMTITRSDIEEDLNQINQKIPKQKSPTQIPKIIQSNKFEQLINSLIKKFF